MKSTPRKKVALLLASACALATSCGDIDEVARDDVEIWRVAIEEAEGSVQDLYAREFERRIEAATGGAVDVKVFTLGSLGTSDQVSEQVRMGAVQFAMASPGHLGKTIPELQVFLLHFIFSDDEAVNRAALDDPELRATIEPLFPPKGFNLLSVLQEGWMVWTANAPIRTPSDFDGVKIRTMTSPLLIETYRQYGASPQAMPYGEVYSGLQLRMIDAQVNPVFAIEEMSFYEVNDVLTRSRPAPFITTFIAGDRFMAEVGDERAELIRRTARELEPFLDERQADLNGARLDAILEDQPRTEVVDLTPAERAAFRDLSLPVRERFVESAGGRSRELLDALLAAVERAAADSSGD